jgi:signal transduction histidine kinase
MRIKDISITKKIFFLTTITLIFYLILNLAAQSLLYTRVYTYQKQRSLIQQTDKFAEEYIAEDDIGAINQKIVDYSNDGKANILVMNKNRNIIHAVTYELVLQTDSGEYIRLQLDSAVGDSKFRALDLKEGDKATVEYVSGGHGETDVLYMPARIAANGIEWNIEHKNRVPFPDDGRQKNEERPRKENITQSADGTVASITLPSGKNTVSIIDRAQLMGAAWQWISGAYGDGDSDNSGHYIYESPDNSKYIVVVKPVEKSGENQTIVAVTTLEPVREAAGVFQHVQIICLLFSIAVIMLLCVILSRYITNPIVDISKIAEKMNSLDFSQKCRVDSRDELGRLAENINSMSDTLDKTITELRGANEKLKSDIERERNIEKSRREFVAAVSHELKTPLAIIRAYSEALRDGVSANKQERYVGVIVDETKKLDALVLDMLENSRLESGTQKPDLKEHDLCDLIYKIINRFSHHFDAKRISVKIKFSSDTIIAAFDRSRLEQVITNFITNAIRHTPNGGSITIRAEKRDCGAYVCIENDGAHIDDDKLDKVWDRFYRLDESRERALGGTGLGLSIAKNILVMHNADYGAENIENGVSFWFLLKHKCFDKKIK